MIQTTIGTEIIPNVISTIRCLFHFFRVSGDIQFGSFDDVVVAVGCSRKFAAVEAVAQSLVEIKIRGQETHRRFNFVDC